MDGRQDPARRRRPRLTPPTKARRPGARVEHRRPRRTLRGRLTLGACWRTLRSFTPRRRMTAPSPKRTHELGFSFSQNAVHSGMQDQPNINDPKLVPNMHALGNVVPVYIDQNILSHLREGKNAREELVGLLRTLREKNAVFVYSMTHVDECRASSQPEQFVKVMEELPAYLMEFQKASEQQTTLSLGSGCIDFRCNA